MFEFYGITNSVMVTAALLSLRNLLELNQGIKQSQRMMKIHLIIFNIYTVTIIVQYVVLYGYI